MALNTQASMSTVLSMNNTKFKKGLNGAKKQLTTFQKQVRSVGGMVAGAFAISAVTSFARSSFQALDTQRKAEAALLTALKGKENVQRSLIRQAQELQKVTLFGDEETIRAQSLLAAFTKEEAVIRRLTPLIQDFATAKQMSLAGAADLVSKTIGSSTNALSRYGIQVEGAVGSTERLDSLVRGLEGAFQGQARAAAEADTSLTQLKNKMGDVKEAMAGLILDLTSKEGWGQIGTVMSSDVISRWDKFLSLFSAQKAMEVSSIALAFDDLIGESPGGTGGFFEDAPSVPDIPILPGIKKITDQIEDVDLGGILDNVFSSDSNWYADLVDRREEMDRFRYLIRDTAGAVTEDLAPALSDTVDNGAAFDEIIKGIGTSIKQELLNNIYALGEAIGETFAGMEGSIKSLAQTILANIGYILMMAGLQMMAINPAVGIGLLAAGGAIQLGGGIWRGLGKGSGATNLNMSNNSGTVNFKISGKDLTGVLDRQHYSNNMNT